MATTNAAARRRWHLVASHRVAVGACAALLLGCVPGVDKPGTSTAADSAAPTRYRLTADADFTVVEPLPQFITLTRKTSSSKEGWRVVRTEPVADPSGPPPEWRESSDGTLELLLVSEVGYGVTATLSAGPAGVWVGTVTEYSDNSQAPQQVGSIRLEPHVGGQAESGSREATLLAACEVCVSESNFDGAAMLLDMLKASGATYDGQRACRLRAQVGAACGSASEALALLSSSDAFEPETVAAVLASARLLVKTNAFEAYELAHALSNSSAVSSPTVAAQVSEVRSSAISAISGGMCEF